MISVDKVSSAFAPPATGAILTLAESTFDKTTQVIRKISGAAPLADPSEKVKDLRLPPELMLELGKHFDAIGYKLEEDTHRFASPTERRYTAAVSTKSKLRIALLNFPPELLSSYNGPYVDVFTAALFTFSAMPCRLLSVEKTDSKIESVAALRRGYNAVVRDMFPTGAFFINWQDIDDYLNNILQENFANLFNLQPRLLTHQNAPNQPKPLGQNEVDSIVDAFAAMAAVVPAGVEPFFRNLVQRSDWSEKQKRRIIGTWSGSADVDAQNLVDFARLTNTYPTTHEKQGQSFLGWVLWEMINNQEVGYPTDQEWARIMIDFNLISDKTVLSKLKKMTA